MIPAHHDQSGPNKYGTTTGSSSGGSSSSSNSAGHSASAVDPNPNLNALSAVAKGKGKALPTSTEASTTTRTLVDDKGDELFYRTFRSEEQDLEGIMRLVEQELSEPYNIYTFRYFLMDWPHLAFLVYPNPTSAKAIATILCKQDQHRRTNRGYIAMLSVDRAWRRRGIASKLVELVIDVMVSRGAHEVVLETEYDNAPSLALYDRLGFVREKRLHRFYSNGKDAFRLILPLDPDPPPETEQEADDGRWAVGAGPGPGQDLEVIYEEGRGTPRPAERPLPEAYGGMYI